MCPVGCDGGSSRSATRWRSPPTTYWSAKTRALCARDRRDAELGPRLEALWEKNYSVYRRRKLTPAAKKAGIEIGRDQVARLMRANGLRGASRAKKRYTTHPDPAAVRAPGLVNRDFTATRPNEKWVADFTYCSTWSAAVYVAFVIDVFSRRIVGWKAARSSSAARASTQSVWPTSSRTTSPSRHTVTVRWWPAVVQRSSDNRRTARTG